MSLRNRETNHRFTVFPLPFCREEFKNINVLGQGFNKKLVNDEILAKFF
ncbi:MAG: hypothetical protein SWH54_00290 [Thermodesulfobacteriota bacterium]|nr:hypothetical protein [Thermodesulfobacteriota bacterium]